MLHCFESFVSKNLKDRQEKYKYILLKKEQEIKELAIQLQKTINNFKNLEIEDKKEYYFIRPFINAKVKIDHKIFPDRIHIFNQDDKYLAHYNLKEAEDEGSYGNFFWISYQYVWWKFSYPGVIDLYVSDKQIAKKWLKKYFKLNDVDTVVIWIDEIEEIEEISDIEKHFKSILNV